MVEEGEAAAGGLAAQQRELSAGFVCEGIGKPAVAAAAASAEGAVPQLHHLQAAAREQKRARPRPRRFLRGQFFGESDFRRPHAAQHLHGEGVEEVHARARKQRLLQGAAQLERVQPFAVRPAEAGQPFCRHLNVLARRIGGQIQQCMPAIVLCKLQKFAVLCPIGGVFRLKYGKIDVGIAVAGIAEIAVDDGKAALAAALCGPCGRLAPRCLRGEGERLGRLALLRILPREGDGRLLQGGAFPRHTAVHLFVHAATEGVERRADDEPFPLHFDVFPLYRKGKGVRLFKTGAQLFRRERPALCRLHEEGRGERGLAEAGNHPQADGLAHAHRGGQPQRRAPVQGGYAGRQLRIGREVHLVARPAAAGTGQGKPLFIGGLPRAPHAAAGLRSLPQQLEAVALVRAEGGTDGKAALPLARDHAHLFAHVPLHGDGDEVFILPEGVAAGVVAAVISPAQIRKAAPVRVSVQNAAVIAHRRPHIGGRAHAAFYLQRIHARAEQTQGVFPHAQVGQGEAVSGRVEAAAVDGIPLTAGLLAQPAVAAVAADDGGKITLPRKAGAQCPLHEAFRFHLRGDGGDVGKGRLAGEDDARKAAALCQPRPVHVAHPRLGGEVQLHRRVRLFEELAQKDVLQDERVGARVPCPQGTGKERLQLAVFDQRVEGDVHFGAQNVGARGIIRQVFEREIRGGLAGGKILQAQIDRVCARAQRRFECGGVARRRQNFCHRHPPNLNTKARQVARIDAF